MSNRHYRPCKYKKSMRLNWAELKWRKAKQIRVALGNLNVDEFKNKPCCPIEERQLNQGVYKSFYLSFIIFASYIFKNSVEAIFKIDFAHARNGCPEVLAMGASLSGARPHPGQIVAL